MTIRGLGRLRRAVQSIRNTFEPRVIILLYHRVAELLSDPHLLCVTPRHFAEHLEVLRRYGRPMRLQRLVQALRDGHLPPRAVVITFDDGYADNFYNAKPLIERYDVPATVFPTTGSIGYEREFWWDELDRLLLQPGTLAESLRLNVNGNTYQWELDEAVQYSEGDYRLHRCWHIGQKDNPSPRHYFYRSMYQLLYALPEEERRKVLDELLVWAGMKSMVRSTHRTLSLDELLHLAEGGLVEVGAHTVTHPVLSMQPPDLQRWEMAESKRRLEAMLGREITTFCYPHGDWSDVGETATRLAQEVGFEAACAAVPRPVSYRENPFWLPRFDVLDWDGDELARRLQMFFRR